MNNKIKARELAEKFMLEIKEYKLYENDCWTLFCDFYKEFLGIELPTFEYGKQMDIAPDRLYQSWDLFKEEDKLEVGDGVLFYDDACGLHMGIYIGDGDILHMNQMSGVNPVGISKISHFRDKIRTFGRYIGE